MRKSYFLYLSSFVMIFAKLAVVLVPLKMFAIAAAIRSRCQGDESDDALESRLSELSSTYSLDECMYEKPKTQSFERT
jgi:hypothetical protein